MDADAGALAVLTLIVGNVVAIVQTNLKRMLAYSTISNVGFIVLGFVAGTPWLFRRAILHAGLRARGLGSFGVMLLASRKGFEADSWMTTRGCTSAIRCWRW